MDAPGTGARPVSWRGRERPAHHHLVRGGNLDNESGDSGIDNVVFSQAVDEDAACYGDFNSDGVLDLFDFLAFVNAFSLGDPGADCGNSCAFGLFDFLCFTNAFNKGC
jgi:hypothetical protein